MNWHKIFLITVTFEAGSTGGDTFDAMCMILLTEFQAFLRANSAKQLKPNVSHVTKMNNNNKTT